MVEMLVVLYIIIWIVTITLSYACVHSAVLVKTYTATATLLLTAVLAYVMFPIFRKIFGFSIRVNSSGKTVLITGCDSGFGNELAKRLASKGFQVFATCFSDTSEGAIKLKNTAGVKLHVLKMDVRKDVDVKNALTYVKSNIGTSRFWAVVNNAGVFKGLDLALTRTEDFTACWETNTMGVVRVTRAFLPLLMESKGRVVTVTSLSSRLSTPHVGAYSMSKFAARSFCEILRQEISPWGVKVIEIEPDFFRTSLTSDIGLTSKFEEDIKYVNDDIKEKYNEFYFEGLKKYLRKTASMASPRIYKVIDALEDAISLMHPKRVYKPCRSIFIDMSTFISEHVPKPVFDAMMRSMDQSFSLPPPNKKL